MVDKVRKRRLNEVVSFKSAKNERKRIMERMKVRLTRQKDKETEK